mmetsp:Transcript_10714/g.19394  ORF Transcript_10714/g.19394 Transcript_10714/m.19394 type:complete len:390 (-) Transcript_10714:244-1413(-)
MIRPLSIGTVLPGGSAQTSRCSGGSPPKRAASIGQCHRPLPVARSSSSPASHATPTPLTRQNTFVPVIDVTALTTEGSSLQERQDAGAHLHTACVEVGFFHLVGHGVDPVLLDSALENAEQFFALPRAAKDDIWIGKSASFRGYQRVQENVTNGRGDFHEAVDFYSESKQAKRGVEPSSSPSNYGVNQWPSAPLTFRPVFEQYVEDMNRLGRQVMSGIALGLNLPEDHFVEFYDDPYWVFRVIHYPPSQQTAPADEAATTEHADLGCGVHTDYGCLTMIHADGTPGCLQAKNTRGKWVTVEPVPGGLTCNIGDMLSRWTNGLYRSTPHRVLRPRGGASRTSIPFFFEPNYRAEIVPMPSCCEATGRPARFSPIVYGDHLLAKTSSNFQL